MNCRSRLVASAALLSLAAGAVAHGVTPQSEALETSATSVRDAVVADAKKSKAAKQVLALLGKKTNARSLADELRSVSAAVKLAEAKLPGLLSGAFADAAVSYAQDLGTTREVLVLATESPTVPKSLRKRWTSSLAKFDRALPSGLADPTLVQRYAGLAAAAAAGKGFTPFDGGSTHDWVMSSIVLAPAKEGVDLDGDGTADNAIGGLRSFALLAGADLDQLFAGIFSQGGSLALIEMWYVQKLAGDPFVLAGMVTATDGDADPSNDFSGSGVFTPNPDGVDAQGHPLVRVATGVAKKGAYTIDFTGQAVQLQGFALPANAKVLVQGQATATSNTGMIGVAIPLDVLLLAMDAGGTPLSDTQKALIGNFADLNLDGKPGNDAFSASFTFQAVAATKTK